MPAKHTITTDAAGKFRFTLFGTNGQVITTSGPYATRRGALIGLAAARRKAGVQETAKSTSTAKRTVKPAAKSTVKRTVKPAEGTVKPAAKSTVKSAPSSRPRRARSRAR